MNTDLELVIAQKVKPLVEHAMQKYLGVKVANIEADISDQLKNSTLLDISINTKLPFKAAKKAFKRAYILRLLQLYLGNISTIATIAGIDRRSIHRLVQSLRIPAAKVRESTQPAYVRQAAVHSIIQDVVENYKSALNPVKYKAFTSQTEALSAEIASALPEQPVTMKEAERAFEHAYFSQLLKEANTLVHAAKIAGIRYEVLHRKIKALGLREKHE